MRPRDSIRRVLVTGATGFIGRHSLDLIQFSGYDEIHAACRHPPEAGRGAVRWHAVDLRDPAAATRLVAEVRPSHILHGAWIATPGVYAHAPENMDWLNAGLALARAFGAVGGLRFVGVGSSAEYAPHDLPCREEETPILPASLYGKCKAACWQAIQAASQHYGFSAAWGRVFLPYGPGDTPQRLIPSVIACLHQGQAIETTHGRQIRDFVFAPDVASMLVGLLACSESGAFNIGTGRGTSVRAVIEHLADHFGAHPLLRFGARPLAAGEPLHLIADMTKTRRAVTGIEPLPLSVGLARILGEPRDALQDAQKRTADEKTAL